MAHGQHAQPPQFFGSVEYHWREAAWHLGVQANFDSGLNLVLTLHKQVKQLLRVHNSLPEIRHQANQGCVPFVHNLETKAKGRHPSNSSQCLGIATSDTLVTFVKVVEPEAMSICLTRL